MTATGNPTAGERDGMTSETRVFRTPLLEAAQRHENLAAGFLLLLFTLVALWPLVAGGIIVGKDTVTQYYPWYTYLGESLRSGEIPAWSPYQFSGAPFAPDPLSGWTYLPAMVLFTILPVSAAAAAYMFFHLLLAGLFTYALARVLHINLTGALLAAVAYEFNGFMYWRNACCSPYVGVMVWLPLAILGAELAIRSSRWLDRGLWWGVGGLALSQILAAWPGQGSYYALLALGGYVAYRTLLVPPENLSGIRGRILGFLLNGGGVLLFGFGLAAAGLLPRLEYHALSSLADGYGSIEGVKAAWGGWTAEDWKRLLVPGLIYPSLAILALALAAPFIARGRHATPYFALLAMCTLILAGKSVTPLHRVLYDVLPGFEWIHPHGPARIKVILYLGLVLLAGATLSRLGERGRGAKFLVTLPILTSLLFVASGADIPATSLVALVVANACLVIYVLFPQGRRMAALLLVIVVFVDLYAADRAILVERATAETGKQLVRVDLARYYEPTGAATFLRSETEDTPARYFGFGPHQHGEKRTIHYNNYFDEPDTTALLASNLGTPSGLQSIQGYNAIHLARYDEYIRELNGTSQGYHNTDIVPRALDSPLLDLLNVRYVVVPAVTQPDQNVLRELKDTHPTVYSDDRVDVLENRDALPRAWIVHSAKRVAPQEALKLLKSGEVDPGQTALLERPPPELSLPEDASADSALVETYEANRITLRTSTGAAGLLVLSEIYYPAWKAYVDGRPVPIYVADQVLRAVPVPEGEHTVELRYESWSLRGGLAISLASYLLLITLVVATVRRRGSRKIPAESATG